MHNYNVNCACFLPLYRKKSDFSFVLCSLIRTFANDHRHDAGVIFVGKI